MADIYNVIPEDILYRLFKTYTLTLDEMVIMGYPIQSNTNPGAVTIYKSPIFSSSQFNVNAAEFKPRNSNSATNHNLPLSIPKPDVKVVQPVMPRDYVYHTRICCRCEAKFYTTDREYITLQPCFYHWGKLQNVSHDRMSQVAYSCCNQLVGSAGCTEAKVHVWNGVTTGMNGLYHDFVPTQPSQFPVPKGNYGVYAMDCEMCYTVRGLDLTKVTVVSVDGQRLYESLVLPECKIVDHNTRFSGITAKDLESAKTLSEVREDLLTFINADTILIGHGLENDLRALKIVHSTVIDTSSIFPHHKGIPFRRSLKNIAAIILKRKIQNNVDGHDSFEDAKTCMDLMVWRLRKDIKL